MPRLLVKCAATYKNDILVWKSMKENAYFALSMSHWPYSPQLQLVEPTRCFHSLIFCCGIFFVALGAAEWCINSVSSFMSLQIVWYWTFVVTLGATKWLVYHYCGFFHVASKCLMWSICSHTGSNWIVFSLVWVLSCLFKLPEVEHL